MISELFHLMSSSSSRAAAGPILVTGARGFLGSHIVSRARTAQLRVIATHRGQASRGAVSLDVCDPANVDAVFRAVQPTVVIHCAAYGVNYAEQDFESALAVNVQASLTLLTAAARHGAQRFVQLGSCAEYGSKLEPIREDATLAPTASYGASKAAATLLLRELARTLRICLVVARPFGIWGPSEAAYRLAPQVIDACLSHSPLQLTPCEVMRDYTYAEDVADTILSLASMPELPPYTTVNVASGRGVLLRDFVLSIARLLDGEQLMQFGALPYRPTEMPSLVADVTHLRALVGERPATSISEGVRRMVNRRAGQAMEFA